jgi:CubicO group peptidase (beta-lactamase class C family)
MRPASLATRAVLLATALCGTAGGAAAAQPATVRPPPYTAEEEALYDLRYQQLQKSFFSGLGAETYDPLETVPGARRHRPLPEATAAQARIDPAALEAARAYSGRNRSSALLVWRDGRLEEAAYFGGSGAADVVASKSLAKPMTAVAVGRAIALGRIRSLDQPVAEFITEWRGDPQRSRILVRHLLDMRPGLLPQSSTAIEPTHILNRAYLHPRHDSLLVHDYPMTDEPGTRYEYSNASSELVALVIERATGRRYAEFLSREVLQPLGAMGGTVWINRPEGLAHSGCCLMLPPESWLRLAVLLLEDGRWQGRRLLPEGYVAEMRRATPQNPYYGMGVYVAGRYTPRRGWLNPEREPEARRVLHSEPYLASDLFLFDGNSNQVVYVVPSQRLVILRVGNNPPRGPEGEWDNAFLPNTILRGLRRAPQQPAPQPQPR